MKKAIGVGAALGLPCMLIWFAFMLGGMRPNIAPSVLAAETSPANVFVGDHTRVIRLCDKGNTVYIGMNTGGRMVSPAIFVVPSMMGVCR